MKIFYGIESIERIKKGSVLTIGSFDGVHAGHAKIFKYISEIAKKNNKESLIITFDPHPKAVLNDIDNNFLLTTNEEKIKLIENYSIDSLLILKFDKSFSKINAEEFINSIIINMLSPSHIVVGYDAHFGKNRMGDIVFLKKITARRDITIDTIEPYLFNGEPISSTQIRKLIKFGNIIKANKLLNYPYFIKGIVIKGEGRGALLGYPTANIEIYDKIKLLPQNGVYFVNVQYKNKIYMGVTNIGNRPTFQKNDNLMEVHILKLNENLYGERLKIYFIKRIRDEIKFNSKEDLIKQLKNDIKQIKSYKEESWL